MKVKQITLGSSTLVLAALLTACGGSSSSGVQKPTPLVANTNNSGNHGATNPAPKWDATIAGIHNKNMTVKLGNDTEEKSIDDIHFFVRGVPTEKLPTTGKFNYSGSGKVGSQSGAQEVNFNYDVDFAAKTGSGSLGNITLSKGNITTQTHTSEIDNSPITAQGIEGKATDGRYSGDYTLGFFGPDADEIVGSVELGDEDVIGIFGGTKKAK